MKNGDYNSSERKDSAKTNEKDMMSGLGKFRKNKINQIMDQKMKNLEAEEAEEDDTIYQSEGEIEIPSTSKPPEMGPVQEKSHESSSYLSRPSQYNNIVFNTADLKVNPLNLLCMNIPAYMGGVTHMWNHAK
jgi:hypothetical protein